MEEENLLTQCFPFLQRLGTQEYDYQFDANDLERAEVFQQWMESIEENDMQSHLEAAGLSAHEMHWLCAFLEMCPRLQQHKQQAGGDAYYPFRQRLEYLERSIGYFLTCGIMRRRDDAEVLLLSEYVLEHPHYLSLVEKLLAHVNEEVGGDPAPSLQRHEVVLLYEFRLQLLKYGEASLIPADCRKPTTVVREEWLYAFKRGQSMFDEPPATMGKWILFASAEEIDLLWKRIARGTSTGMLGIRAKVSTARPKKTKHTQEYILYVYTQDAGNQEDIMRVRSRLREMGVVQEIAYRQEKAPSKEARQHNLYVL